MAKTKAKKSTPKGEYLLEVKMNDETYSVETDDLDQALQDLKPEQFLSEVYVKVTKGEHEIEKRLSLNEARRVFLNGVNREVFVNNLLIVNG